MSFINWFIIVKELPPVFNIAARALTSQALNVHAGHDDVMGVSDTGWGIAFSKNVQDFVRSGIY